jgi:thioredoxin reductase
MTRIDAVDCNASIAIIGAGPVGLSTAWFLSKPRKSGAREKKTASRQPKLISL